MSNKARRNYVKATSQVKEHKIMHKVRKHWVTLGISALMMIAGGITVAQSQVHANADSTTPNTESMGENQAQNSAHSQSAVNNSQSTIKPVSQAQSANTNLRQTNNQSNNIEAIANKFHKSLVNQTLVSNNTHPNVNEITNSSASDLDSNASTPNYIENHAHYNLGSYNARSQQSTENQKEAYANYLKQNPQLAHAYNETVNQTGSNNATSILGNKPLMRRMSLNATPNIISGYFPAPNHMPNPATWTLNNSNGDFLIHDGNIPDFPNGGGEGVTHGQYSVGISNCSLIPAHVINNEIASKIKHISFSNAIATKSVSGLVSNLPNVEDINFKGLTLASNQPISFATLAAGDNNLKVVNLEGLDTTHVISDGGMFYGDESLTTLRGLSDLNLQNLDDANGMFNYDPNLKELDLSKFNTTAARNNNHAGDNGNGLDGLISHCPNLKTVILGPNTILTNKAIEGNKSLSYAQNVNSGQQFGEDLHQLADSDAHPGTWQIFHGYGGEYQNTNNSALWALQNDGTLFLENGTISTEPSESNFKDWNNVKRVVYHNVNSPSNKDLLSEINDVVQDNTGINGLQGNKFIQQDPSATNIVNSARASITSASNYVITNGLNPGSAANADYNANSAYNDAQNELEIATENDFTSQETSETNAHNSLASSASSFANSKVASQSTADSLSFARESAIASASASSAESQAVANADTSTAQSIRNQSIADANARAQQSTNDSNALAHQSYVDSIARNQDTAQANQRIANNTNIINNDDTSLSNADAKNSANASASASNAQANANNYAYGLNTNTNNKVNADSANASVSAANAQNNAQNYASGLNKDTDNVVNTNSANASASASNAQANAKNYAYGLNSSTDTIVNLDSANASASASNAQSNANSYTDSKIAALSVKMSSNANSLANQVKSLSSADVTKSEMSKDVNSLQSKEQADLHKTEATMKQLALSNNSQKEQMSNDENMFRNALANAVTQLSADIDTKADWSTVAHDENLIKDLSSQLDMKSNMSDMTNVVNKLIRVQNELPTLVRHHSHKFHGVRITQVNLKHHFRYFNLRHAIGLHTSPKFTRRNFRGMIKPRMGLTFYIDKMFVVHYRTCKAYRYEITLNHHKYFVTALSHYVKNAYFQNKDIKHSHMIRVNRPCDIYTSTRYNRFTRIGSAWRGRKLHVRKVVNISRPYHEMTRFYIGHGLYITSNKNFVSVI